MDFRNSELALLQLLREVRAGSAPVAPDIADPAIQPQSKKTANAAEKPVVWYELDKILKSGEVADPKSVKALFDEEKYNIARKLGMIDGRKSKVLQSAILKLFHKAKYEILTAWRTSTDNSKSQYVYLLRWLPTTADRIAKPDDFVIPDISRSILPHAQDGTPFISLPGGDLPLGSLTPASIDALPQQLRTKLHPAYYQGIRNLSTGEMKAKIKREKLVIKQIKTEIEEHQNAPKNIKRIRTVASPDQMEERVRKEKKLKKKQRLTRKASQKLRKEQQENQVASEKEIHDLFKHVANLTVSLRTYGYWQERANQDRIKIDIHTLPLRAKFRTIRARPKTKGKEIASMFSLVQQLISQSEANHPFLEKMLGKWGAYQRKANAERRKIDKDLAMLRATPPHIMQYKKAGSITVFLDGIQKTMGQIEQEKKRIITLGETKFARIKSKKIHAYPDNQTTAVSSPDNRPRVRPSFTLRSPLTREKLMPPKILASRRMMITESRQYRYASNLQSVTLGG